MRNRSLLGISSRFRLLSPSVGQVVYALLTRSPLRFTRASSHISPFDLHVLGTPPAFVLSQDQTLCFYPLSSFFELFWLCFPLFALLFVYSYTVFNCFGSLLSFFVSFLILSKLTSFVNIFFIFSLLFLYTDSLFGQLHYITIIPPILSTTFFIFFYFL